MTMPSPGVAADAAPLSRSTPEAQGLSSAAVLAFVDRFEREGHEPHSLMIIRHGVVVAEGWWAPYHRDGVGLLYSLSKSFCSTAVGLAVGEGRFGLEDKLSSFFPEAAVDAGPVAADLTVHRALSMSTGHRTDTFTAMAADRDHLERGFFDYEPEMAPGSWFVYNNGATFMAGAVTQQQTGERLLDYLRPRLFDKIGIGRAGWQSVPDGRDMGFSGLHLSTEAIGRFGQLILSDGVWDGERVLPEGWVARATSALTDNSMNDAGPDWKQGYGYQFWRCQHNAFRGDGAYGQYCIVLPEHDAVVVITSAQTDMQGALNCVWEELLPGFAPESLPADHDARAALAERLASASIPVVSGGAAPAGEGPWTWTYEPTESHPSLRSVTLRADGSALVIDDGGEVTVPLADGVWPPVASPYVSSGGWTAPDVFEARVNAVEGPHDLILHATLDADGAPAMITASWNVEPLRWRSLADLHAPTD